MLGSFFFDTAASQPDGPALWVDDRLYRYREIALRARRIAAGLKAVVPAGSSGRCLLFAHRSVAAYAGLLGIIEAGFAYVPLNPRVPAARTAAVIEQSGAPVLLVDRRYAASLDELLSLLDDCPRVFLLDEADAAGEEAGGLTMLPSGTVAPVTEARPQNLAYILFTSGSTGAPKGVPISHANADAYVKAQMARSTRAWMNWRFISDRTASSSASSGTSPRRC